MKINKSIKCCICGSNQSKIKFESSSFVLEECIECQMLRKNYKAELNKEAVQKIQDKVYSDLGRLKIPMMKKMSKDRFDLLYQQKKNGRLLEIGCATGEFLDIASEQGFESTGLEASKLYSDYAKSRGLRIVNGYLEDLKREETFDVISMFHLFEHIEEPNDFLANLSIHLDKDGVIMFVVPNQGSFTNKIFGYHHPVYQQTDHLFFYNQKTLSSILEKNGFKILSIQSLEYPHHPFTSLSSYLAKKYKRITEREKKVGNRVSEKTVVKSNVNEKINNISLKPYLRILADKIPYLMGIIFYPILKIYGNILERRISGHELIIFATKAE